MYRTRKRNGGIAAVLAAVLALSLAGPVSAADDPDLLVAYDFTKTVGTVVPDSSGRGNDAQILGAGATVIGDELRLPGGGSNSGAGYLQLPTGLFDGRNTLTLSAWMKNETGPGNYAGMFFGSPSSPPSQYWLLNPANPDGRFKSVITNGQNASAPWTTEAGISPTNSATGVTGPQTSTEWGLYTTVITPTSITGYLNGVSLGTVATTRTVSQFGTGLVSYIGRSSYPDIFYKGGVRDVRVWAAARTGTQVRDDFYERADAAAIDAVLDADASALKFEDIITDNLTLSTSGAQGSAISWSSDKPEIVASNGTVVRPAGADAAVTLTATLSLRSRQIQREFKILVAAEGEQRDLQLVADRFNLGITHVSSNIVLPVTLGDVSVSWSSTRSDLVSSGGRVTRPDAETEIDLTATFSRGGLTVSRQFDLVVLAKDSGFVGSYITPGDTTRRDVLHLAVSPDGTNYTAVNNGRGLLYPTLGGTRFGNPELFRKPNGTFGLVAPSNSTSTQLYVYDSPDLVTYTNERLVTFSSIEARRVVVDYDNGILAYRIRFQAANGGAWNEVTTADFTTFSEPVSAAEPSENTGGSYPAGAIEASALPVTAAEYAFVSKTLSRTVNTGVKPFERVETHQGKMVGLPATATVEYSGGSTTTMGVEWDSDDVAAVNGGQPGTYKVDGTVVRPTYSNPLVERRADPDVTLGDDGWYYFTASYPTVSNSDPEGYDRIILRRARTIEGLKTAPETVIWDEANDPVLNRYIWAPELTKIGDDWFILFTAGRNGVFDIRPAVLKFTGAQFGGEATLNPANWTSLGQVKSLSGDPAFTAFSLDMTYLEAKGRHYVTWAQYGADGSMLFMAEINPADPTQLITPSMVLSSPKFAWEKNQETNQSIDEGPGFLKHQGRIFASFSAATVDDKYAVGLLVADENADLLDPASWQKMQYPVLSTADVHGQVGPGHNSFTVDEYGNPVIVYHSRTLNDVAVPGEASDFGLNDPRRHARAATVHWDSAGLPVFNMTAEEELRPEFKRVQVDVVVKAVEPVLSVTASASSRCIAGKVVLTVKATNGDDVPVSVNMTTAYGAKSFSSIAPGKNASQAFTTRAVSIPTGTATVEASATVDGKLVTASFPANYQAMSCN
uniref:family 43 glycosylhydrolase n=1 Tax=Paenarthrobacter nicotinovorans TaxID=29320 RepID=UPI003F491C34